MTFSHEEETYYEILKVDRKATVTEIVAAYHAAKNAFSKDSVATYSLFNPDEVQEVIGKLEEAYQTLSNLERRAEYDKRLLAQSRGEEIPSNMTELERMQNAGQSLRPPQSAGVTPSQPSSVPSLNDTREMRVETVTNTPKPPTELDSGIPLPSVASSNESVTETEISGAWLKGYREKRGLNPDDVARITKIPGRFIKSLEADAFAQFPARVYVQGFVKNLATLYRLDPDQTMKAYLAYLDRNVPQK